MCDGASRDEVLFHTHEVIERFGWMVLGVETRPPSPPWAYTIGLASNFDHPELVVVGERDTHAARVLNELGGYIREGARFDVGDPLFVDDSLVELGHVHPRHIERGLVNHWQEYFGSLGPPYPDLYVVQVLMPSRSCRRHNSRRPRLDTPDDVMHLDP
jgi:hypothetical protein